MDNLKKSIETYIAEKEPGYALQITGEWGSGKTYSINEILKENMYYISVFSFNKVDDLYSSAFYAMYKNKTDRKIRGFFNNIKNIKFSFKGIGIPVGSGADFLVKTIIKDEIKNDKVIVIDDIERSSIPLTQIFGFVSDCLENHGCNVILLMNDRALTNHTDLVEKAVGRTLKIDSDFESAYDAFIKDKDKDSKKVLIKLKSNIINVFKKIDCKSLRVLNRVIFEIDMICKCIDDKVLNKYSYIFKDNLIVFCALSISVKKDNMDIHELKERKPFISYMFKYDNGKYEMNEKEKKYFDLYQKIGSDINLASDFIDDNTIIDILINGIFSSIEIKKSISTYIDKIEGNITPWKIIYNYISYSDQAIYNAMNEINEIFSGKKKCDLGNVLHFISAILYMKEIYCELFKINEINGYIAEYIDFLYENTDCFFDDYSNVSFDGIYQNSHGSEYYAKDNVDFKKLINEIKNKVDNFTEEKLESVSSKLNHMIDLSIDEFLSFTRENFNKNNFYTKKPILNKINTDGFALKITESDYHTHDEVYKFFLYRYANNELKSSLEGESMWFDKLIDSLKLISDSKSGLLKMRINHFISRLEYLTK
ncbi:P-loop NTPase fold protein [Providencia stuartii]|uniref:P-loop NTPase fold protein n=1 Tax=Providencia stuartii TaxID=588 RepID=UPI0030024F70